MGYTIMRPDNWYWQHFMKNNLTAAGTNELIDDYFISDKNALIGLGSEYLGQIVIEKSRFDLEELKKNMTGYASKQITVAGQPATRFEIQTNENKMIEYHFEKGEQTFRLMYVSSDLPQNQSIFEAVVKSFTFVE